MQRETKWKLRIEEPLQLGEKWFMMEENSKVKVYGCRSMRGEVLGLGDGGWGMGKTGKRCSRINQEEILLNLEASNGFFNGYLQKTAKEQ